jgi:hypothetical protein
MNVHLAPSTIDKARDVSALEAEEVARLVEESGASTTIGTFATDLIEEPWRAHLLRSAPVNEVSGGGAVLRFETSTAFFRVKEERPAERMSAAAE